MAAPTVDEFFDVLIEGINRSNKVMREMWEGTLNFMHVWNQDCFCSNCNWTGKVFECEPDVDNDGNLGCPTCFEVITVHDINSNLKDKILANSPPSIVLMEHLSMTVDLGQDKDGKAQD